MTSHTGSLSGMKDPFASPTMPKSFYHPTRSRGVDIKTAIAGPERCDVAQSSEADENFLNGNENFISSHLHKLKSSKANHHNASHRSDDNFHEVWPESEQPSAISVQADISPFTSVSDEAERDNIGEQSHIEYSKGKYSSHKESVTDKKPVKTVLQKYIDRFRHSEPKSKTEREKESEANYQDFWWMNSAPSSPADTDSHAYTKRSSHMPVSVVKKSQGEAPFERRLTKEAVMELDQETSRLQNKTDQILSRSQLSLASSGPIVSTQGLGSSTTMSEYSFKSDSQVPYRPAFVNIKEHHSMSEEEEIVRQHQIVPKVSSPPGDILAKWRLRRKMEEVKPCSSKGNTKPLSKQGVFRNKEMNMKLAEFRKKLFSQRAVVTQEEIQYEREKMNLLMEEESGNTSSVTQAKEPGTEDRKGQMLINPQADPILLRLKTITGAQEVKMPSVSSLSNVNKENINNQSVPNGEMEHPGEKHPSIEINSNLNNAYSKLEPGFSSSQRLDGNTAVSAGEDNTVNGNKHSIVDQVDSIILCDGNMSIALDQRNDKKEGVCEKCQNKVTSVSSHAVNEEETIEDDSTRRNQISNKESGHEENLPGFEKPNSVNSNCDDSDESSSQKRQVYHQYLVAEKPSVEINKKIRKTTQVEDETLSDKSEKSQKRSRLKKKERRDGKSSSRDKRDRARDTTEKDFGQEESVNEDKDSVCSVASSKADNSRVAEHHSTDEYERSEAHSKTPYQLKDKSDNLNTVRHRSHSSRSREGEPTQDRQATGKGESFSQSPGHRRIQKAVVQTVVDHMFDGPSVISSVDSWASLFPQSPAPSRFVHDSDLPTPSPYKGNVHSLQSTPTHTPSLTTVPDIDEAACSESDNEFEDDPLLALLRQQRQEYIQKLEAIESALLSKDR